MAASRNKPSTDLRQRVAAFVATRLAPDEPACLALSGGCDSVVLLHLLVHAGLAGRLQALHVHHGLSPNADAWAVFCTELCGRLAVPCSVMRVQVDAASGQGLEAAARVARHAAFAQSACPTLFLAHHAGDQAETLLFNLLRGAGVSGLAAMPDERQMHAMRFLRPLLGVSRREIEAYAQAHDLDWITDESNGDTRFSRNFLRHDVLPLLTARFPAVEQAFGQAAAHCAEADGLLAELARMDWLAHAEGEALNMRRLRLLSLPRLKNLLRFRLRSLKWRVPETSRLEEFSRQLLTAAPDRHPQLDLPEGCLRVMGGQLHWLGQR